MYMRDGPVIWLSAALQEQCAREGDSKFPNETGGVFMGYWHDPGCAVVTAVIGPGPDAVHERYSFEPDHRWQLAEIAGHYDRSGRHETYIGDWHTHPGAISGTLSRTDRQVVRRIINTPAARAPTPLIAVFFGEESAWDVVVWRGSLSPRPLLWAQLRVDPMALRTY